MNPKTLLYIAAFFTLFTFLGHSAGTLLPHPPESEAIGEVINQMYSTMVPMPIGSPRSLGQMAYGGNAFISLYFLVTGIFFLLLAKPGRQIPSLLLVNCIGIAAASIFSAIFYFPLPAICTGISAVLGFIAYARIRGHEKV
jgi:hypothetical protein